MFHQYRLAGLVAVVHGAELRDGDVGFVDDRQEIAGEVTQECCRLRTGGASAEVAGIVFDAGAVADFLEHFHVIHGAHFDALGFQQFAVGLEPADAFLHFGDDGRDGDFDFLVGHDEVGGGRDDHAVEPAVGVAADDVEIHGLIELVAEEFQADALGGIGGEDIHGIPPDAESAGFRGVIVTGVLDGDQFLQEFIPVDDVAGGDGDNHVAVVLGRAEAVDAGDGGHDDDVVPGEEGIGGGETEAFDLLVDGSVLLDVGVCLGDIGLGLVIVVIADEVFHGVIGEEDFQFRVELGGEGFIVRDHQGWAVVAGDDVGDGEGFPGTGDALQNLEAGGG